MFPELKHSSIDCSQCLHRISTKCHLTPGQPVYTMRGLLLTVSRAQLLLSAIRSPHAHGSPHHLFPRLRVSGACRLYVSTAFPTHTRSPDQLTNDRAGAARAGDTTRTSKPVREHGSVLLQFAEKKEQEGQLTVGAKVVQAGKDFTYVIVILGGFALTGFLFWTVGSEFFSSSSTSSLFASALKAVKADSRVRDLLGEPIAGYGEESGRGRRRDILSQKYVVDNKEYMRIMFYVKGSKKKGTVQMDLVKNDKGKYDCRFLFMELQDPPYGTVVISDNR